MVIIDQSNEPLEGRLIVRNWKGTNRVNTSDVWTDTYCANGVAQETHFSLAKFTLPWINYQALTGYVREGVAGALQVNDLRRGYHPSKQKQNPNLDKYRP